MMVAAGGLASEPQSSLRAALKCIDECPYSFRGIANLVMMSLDKEIDFAFGNIGTDIKGMVVLVGC